VAEVARKSHPVNSVAVVCSSEFEVVCTVEGNQLHDMVNKPLTLLFMCLGY